MGAPTLTPREKTLLQQLEDFVYAPYLRVSSFCSVVLRQESFLFRLTYFKRILFQAIGWKPDQRHSFTFEGKTYTLSYSTSMNQVNIFKTPETIIKDLKMERDRYLVLYFDHTSEIRRLNEFIRMLHPLPGEPEYNMWE